MVLHIIIVFPCGPPVHWLRREIVGLQNLVILNENITKPNDM